MSERVVVRSTDTGKELWGHALTGQPFINYVPSVAFHMVDSGEAEVKVEGAINHE